MLRIAVALLYGLISLKLTEMNLTLFGKFCIKGVTCFHGNLVFDAMFTQILTSLFLNFSSLTKFLQQGLIVSLKVNRYFL